MNRWIFHNIYYWYLYNHHPTYWRNTVRRILRGKKVCRTCWKYPFACVHMDKEVWEALRKDIEEDRIPRIKLPR